MKSLIVARYAVFSESTENVSTILSRNHGGLPASALSKANITPAAGDQRHIVVQINTRLQSGFELLAAGVGAVTGEWWIHSFENRIRWADSTSYRHAHRVDTGH